MVSGLGLLTVAVAETIARAGSEWGGPVFWVGMFMLWPEFDTCRSARA